MDYPDSPAEIWIVYEKIIWSCENILYRTQVYNNFYIIAGQGTAALELLEIHPELDNIITPVGGGGLLAGTSITAKAIKPSIKVFAGEPKGAEDAYQSFKAGKIIPSINPGQLPMVC